MKNKKIQRVHIGVRPFLSFGLWTFLALTLASGCSGRDESEGLTLGVVPQSFALIGPGPDSSCVDHMTLRRAIMTQTASIPLLSRSVSGPVISFSSFYLKWDSRDTFFVQGIRVKVTGSGIRDGEYSFDLPASEIEALIGLPQAVIHASSDTSKTFTEIRSDDDVARFAVTNPLKAFAPCGLKFGNVPLVNGNKTDPFTAQVTIEVIGTAQDGDRNQRFVRQRIQTLASYYGS